MKSTVLLFGNCQAEYLGRILNRVPSLACRFQFNVVVYHVLDQPGRGWDSVPARWFAAPLVVWEQLTNTFEAERRQFHARLPAGSRTLTFPSFSMLSLWPFLGSDSRQVRERGYPDERRYLIADHVAAAIAAEPDAAALSDDALFGRYMARSEREMPDLRRRLAMDEGRWRERDAEADVKVGEYVRQNFRRERLFHDHSHVGAAPLRFLLDRLVETLAPHGADLATARAELDRMFDGYAGQEWAQVPLHPLVAERLELEYYRRDETYLWNGNEVSFRDYILRYIRWMPWI